MDNLDQVKSILRNEMCRLEEAQDCCSEAEYDELEFQLCYVETAYIHVDRGIELTSKDYSVINDLKSIEKEEILNNENDVIELELFKHQNDNHGIVIANCGAGKSFTEQDLKEIKLAETKQGKNTGSSEQN